MKPFQKYTTLFSLYIAQSVPMSFFSTVLPVIMRMNNFSMSGIALIQLIKLPWILKFLWAPLIDKNSSSNTHYKRWIIGSELFYAGCIIAIAFLNLEINFNTIIILMVLAIIFSATQDIASDAFAIRILKKDERAFGNSIQSMGNFGGTLLGSGFLLMLYAITGWTWLMIALAAFVLLALLPLIFMVKKSNDTTEVIQKQPVSIKDIYSFFRIKGIGNWLIVLAVYYSGILGILSTLKPWMVDLGYSVKEIAFMVGIFGTACGTVGAFCAGFIIRKFKQRKSLIGFAVLNMLTALFFLLFSLKNGASWIIYAAIAMVWMSYAMSSVLVFTISMDKVRQGKEGTDYSIQIALTHLMGIVVAIMAGKLADLLGMTGLFAIESALALGVLVLVVSLSKKITKQH